MSLEGFLVQLEMEMGSRAWAGGPPSCFSLVGVGGWGVKEDVAHRQERPVWLSQPLPTAQAAAVRGLSCLHQPLVSYCFSSRWSGLSFPSPSASASHHSHQISFCTLVPDTITSY